MNRAMAYYELRNTVVGIAGLGGLGSNVATALTRLGVGKLVLVDFDTIEHSNLNRQQYFMDQVGRPKVDAMLENLERINHLGIEMVGVRTKLKPDNIPDIFGDVQVVAECFDRADQKQMIAETVLTSMPDTVLVSASGLAGYGRSNEVQTHRLSDRHILVGDLESGIGPGNGLTAPRVGLVAYHQANAIAEVLIGELSRVKVRHRR